MPAQQGVVESADQGTGDGSAGVGVIVDLGDGQADHEIERQQADHLVVKVFAHTTSGAKSNDCDEANQAKYDSGTASAGDHQDLSVCWPKERSGEGGQTVSEEADQDHDSEQKSWPIPLFDQLAKLDQAEHVEGDVDEAEVDKGGEDRPPDLPAEDLSRVPGSEDLASLLADCADAQGTYFAELVRLRIRRPSLPLGHHHHCINKHPQGRQSRGSRIFA